jgi:hypothetical protein
LAGALLDGDYDKVRQVLCKATMKSAFAERFALEATQFKASVEPWIHTRPDALIADGGDSRAWRLRPDRTGTFVLRSPYLFGEKGPVSAPPVKLHVLPADADLPLEVAPRDSTDAWTRKHVCSALAVIPDAYLAARLSRQWNDVDIYDLALHGLFASTSPEAPRLYAALAFKPVKPELDELDVTMAMVPRRSKSLPKADQLQTAVLKRALEGEGPFATLRHFIDSEVGRDKAGFIPGLAVECAKTENEWRVALLEHASGRADLDAIAVSRLETGRFFGSLPEETHARILDEVDTGGGIYRPRPHPFSLHALLAQWGRDWGLELEIGPKVPDLQADEYQLALPWLPQVRELNRRLSGSGLRARRDGRRVTIETMPAALVLRPELTEFYAAPDATKRLAWYLHGPTVSALDSAQGRASTFNIVVLMQGDASVDLGPGFRYCPRVSVPGDVDPGEVWEKLVKATRYPRLHDLRRIGLNYKVDDGVLRFEKQ